MERPSPAGLQPLAGPQMLDAILTSAVEAIFTIDDLGIIRTANPATERLFGYAPGELLGQNVKILMTGEHRHKHDGYISNFIRTGEARIIGIGREVEARRKDGTPFPVHLSVSTFIVDGKRYFSGILHDLGERNRIQSELTRQWSIFETVFNNVPNALIIADASLRITLCNAAVARLFGSTPGEFVGRSLADVYATPGDYERVRDAFATPGQQRLEPLVAGYRHSDGATFPGETIGAQIVAQGNPRPVEATGLLILIRDVSRDLEQQMALHKAQRMEAFGQLTGGIAHDFNNLLTVIMGNHELLEMRLEDAKNRMLLRRAQEAAEMGARLTARLLTFARRRQLETIVLDLNDQVIGMAELLRRTLGEHVDVNTVLKPRLWHVSADPSEIENAILNLAINARDAMPKGGKLIIETDNVTLDDEAARSRGLGAGDWVSLAISDTGIGMPPDVLQRVFEPFFTTKAPGKGTGLGLSGVYGFVRQLGGSVAIESTIGAGTRVSILLPRADGPIAAAGAGPERETIPLSAGERVLLVEDNTDVRQVTRTRLEDLGYVVVEAGCGSDAVDILNSGQAVDIVFSDVVMPGGMSGFDVCRWVRENQPRTRLLLASGFAEKALEQQEVPVADVEILRKPYDRGDLARALRRALDA